MQISGIGGEMCSDLQTVHVEFIELVRLIRSSKHLFIVMTKIIF